MFIINETSNQPVKREKDQRITTQAGIDRRAAERRLFSPIAKSLCNRNIAVDPQALEFLKMVVDNEGLMETLEKHIETINSRKPIPELAAKELVNIFNELESVIVSKQSTENLKPLQDLFETLDLDKLMDIQDLVSAANAVTPSPLGAPKNQLYNAHTAATQGFSVDFKATNGILNAIHLLNESNAIFTQSPQTANQIQTIQAGFEKNTHLLNAQACFEVKAASILGSVGSEEEVAVNLINNLCSWSSQHMAFRECAEKVKDGKINELSPKEAQSLLNIIDANVLLHQSIIIQYRFSRIYKNINDNISPYLKDISPAHIAQLRSLAANSASYATFTGIGPKMLFAGGTFLAGFAVGVPLAHYSPEAIEAMNFLAAFALEMLSKVDAASGGELFKLLFELKNVFYAWIVNPGSESWIVVTYLQPLLEVIKGWLLSIDLGMAKEVIIQLFQAAVTLLSNPITLVVGFTVIAVVVVAIVNAYSKSREQKTTVDFLKEVAGNILHMESFKNTIGAIQDEKPVSESDAKDLVDILSLLDKVTEWKKSPDFKETTKELEPFEKALAGADFFKFGVIKRLVAAVQTIEATGDPQSTGFHELIAKNLQSIEDAINNLKVKEKIFSKSLATIQKITLIEAEIQKV